MGDEGADPSRARSLAAELKRRLALLELAGEQRSLGHWTLTPARNELEWSRHTKRIHGLAPEDASPDLAGAIEFYHPDDRQRVADHVAQAIEKNAPFDFEARIIRVDGSERDVQATGIVHTDEEGPVVFGIFEDVTDKKRTEEQLREAQRQEQLSSLAGAIAHDFNNLLTGILGNASLALMPGSSVEDMREAAEAITRLSEHGAKLTKQLLAFAGRGRFTVSEVDVAAMVGEMEPLLRVVIPKNVQLRVDVRPRRAVVSGDALQLQQLLVNLVTNAAEAIGDDKGTVQLIVDTRSRGREPTNGTVVFEVIDDGRGMAPETRAQLFDPFFSTKPKGHGLGLAAVQGIVSGHEGIIEVESELGRGATFRVALPQVAGQGLDASSQPPVSAAGTILVVDDEDALRRVVRRGLERFGFAVSEAADGREGLTRFRRSEASVDLVLLDLTMPEVSGLEVFREIRREHPQARVLLMSGYHRQGLDEELDDFASFILKPFRIPELVETMRKLMAVGLT